jgi:hypothetical protein
VRERVREKRGVGKEEGRGRRKKEEDWEDGGAVQPDA